MEFSGSPDDITTVDLIACIQEVSAMKPKLHQLKKDYPYPRHSKRRKITLSCTSEGGAGCE
ncbi:MAG: hypothetical protein ABW185_15665 [Sedimenticola sp.]